MGFVITALAFLLLLSVLILIHECGHFFMARKAGVTVEEFGFGLPPRAFTVFSKGGTKFTINWIPFGGFVRLKGENAESESDRTAPGSFGAASIPARIAILIAGVFMNFIFAILIFTIGFSAGKWIPTYLSYDELKTAAARGEVQMTPSVLIDAVMEDGTAAVAGVPPLSILTHIDGVPVREPEDVIQLQEGKEVVTYRLQTGESFAQQREYRMPVTDGKTGVSIRPYPRDLTVPPRSIGTAVALSFREAKVMTVQTVLGMRQLVTSLASQGKVPEGITGIVGIAGLTHVSVQQGFMTYLRLVALLSLSLAVLNILPLPALDGGRLLFVLFELVRRKPANRRFELTTNMVGFVVLITLILVITYHDILRLF